MEFITFPEPLAPRPWNNMTPTPSILIPFPIELPDDLLEEWDCLQNKTQFAAFHYDRRNCRLLRENGISIKPCPNAGLFTALCAYPEVAEWCVRNKLQLLAGTHWLIYDYHDGKAYVGRRCTAMKCVEQQAVSRG